MKVAERSLSQPLTCNMSEGKLSERKDEATQVSANNESIKHIG